MKILLIAMIMTKVVCTLMSHFLRMHVACFYITILKVILLLIYAYEKPTRFQNPFNVVFFNLPKQNTQRFAK